MKNNTYKWDVLAVDKETDRLKVVRTETAENIVEAMSKIINDYEEGYTGIMIAPVDKCELTMYAASVGKFRYREKTGKRWDIKEV